MPKMLDYPKSSFKNSIQMAEAITSLGGKCDRETCANQMGLKFSGAFSKRIGAALKFNLITSGKGELAVSELYKSIKTAYNEDEEREFMIKAFLSPSVFRELYNRFKGQEIPVKILDKLLIREYEVAEGIASAVAKHFREGSLFTGLLDASNKLLPEVKEHEEILEDEEVNKPIGNPNNAHSTQKPTQNKSFIDQFSTDRQLNEYIVHITGPGIDSRLMIKEEEDLFIVEAMLKKVKGKL
jgi:hypothetical protein